MSLIKNELIDIKNALIFGKWFKQMLKLKPEYKKKGSKLDTYAAILLMCEEYPEFLGDGWTAKSQTWLKTKLKYYKNKSNFKTTPLLSLNFDWHKWFMFVIQSYIYFIQDEEWMKNYQIDNLRTINNNKVYINKIKKNYTQVVEWMFGPKHGNVPGWMKKYWKIIQSKN